MEASSVYGRLSFVPSSYTKRNNERSYDVKLRTAGAGTLQNFALYTLCGTFLYAVCAGFRDNYGIMLPYIVEWSGIPYSTLSFVIALGQLFFGLMQPVFGLLALRTSARAVLWTGSLMMLAGLLLIPLSASAPLLTLALGILLPSGTAAASFGIIMSCISPRLSPHQAHISSGFVASGIGIGICVLSPAIQSTIAAHGLTGAIWFLTMPGAAAHSRVGGDNQASSRKKTRRHLHRRGKIGDGPVQGSLSQFHLPPSGLWFFYLRLPYGLDSDASLFTTDRLWRLGKSRFIRPFRLWHRRDRRGGRERSGQRPLCHTPAS